MSAGDPPSPPAPRISERTSERPSERIVEHLFEDRAEMSRSLAAAVADDLRAALGERAHATLAVPGGTTPRAFLRALRDEPLDWPRLRVTLTDERWVPADHPDSNERMVRAELLAGPAARAVWVALYTDHADPAAARDACERLLGPLLPLDVVVLGMGEDGHVASLFPLFPLSQGQPALAAALDPAGERLCGPTRAPGTSVPRLSLFAPMLFTARRSYLLIAGAEKLTVYRRALAGADPEELPVAALLEHAPSPLHVYWAP